MFKQLDRDNDGQLCKAEIKEAYQIFGKNSSLPEDEIEEIFTVVDHNKNGVIDYTEFITSCSNIVNLMSDN